jgi:dUTP pyrophosphatase
MPTLIRALTRALRDLLGVPDFVVETLFDEVPLPTRATVGASGFDCGAFWDPTTPALSAEGRQIDGGDGTLVLHPGERAAISTGLRIAIPDGWEIQVRPRSGNALKAGVTVVNTPGTVDMDYRGDIKAILINHGTTPFVIRRGDRIAQLVPSRVWDVRFRRGRVDRETARGSGGFGSTGGSSAGTRAA